MYKLAKGVIGRLDVVSRYVHNHPVHEPLPLFPFDAIAECWFASSEDAVRVLATSALQPIHDNLATFCDVDRSVTMLTSVSHRWPKG